MFCSSCGQQVPAHAQFCATCGGKQPGNVSNKRLVRPLNGRKVGGVCAAIANHLNVDVTLVRVVAVLAIIIPPFPMLLVYVICWFVIPSEDAYPVPVASPGPVPGAQSTNL